MDSFIPLGGFQLPFQRRLSRLYNDTKKSSDFVSTPVQNAEDPEIKALHRKLRIQKDRFVSWGLEWSDPNQSAEIDESLSKAGLSEIVGSIMSTIKDILAEAEPLWQSSKRQLSSERRSEKSSGDSKITLVVWDRARFEDLVRDLTTSIDTLYDLSRTRSSVALSSQHARSRMFKSSASTEELRPFESTRMQTPQQVDPKTLTSLRDMQAEPMSESANASSRREVVFMSKQAWSEMSQRTGRQPWAPLLLEFAGFDSIYSTTGIMPPMARFEKMSAGLQQESQRSPGAWTGLPRLLGYFEDLEHSRLGLVYHFPQGFNAVSFEQYTQNPLYNLCTLGDLLSRPDFEPRLEAKFRLAYNLANTVFDMHVRGITHGNLIDANISFCNAANAELGTARGEVDVRRPLISAFELFPDAFTDDKPSPSLPLFRHPLDPRTTSHSPISGRMDSRILDLYSLAMVLLSIGLWTKLENLVADPSSPSIPESVLEQLAIRCGTLYTKAVQACWEAVDVELSGRSSGEELLSNIQVKASRYLEACCILDGVSGLEERFGHDARDEALSPVPAAGQRSQSGPSGERKTSETAARQAVEPTAFPISHVAELPTFSGDKKESQLAKVDAAGMPKELPVAKKESSKLRMYPQVPLPPDAIEKWNTVIMPQINHALRQFYRKNPESVEISLESIGVSPQKTRPTVLVICTSVSKVKAILIRKMGELFDGAQGFGLKVCRGQVLRSRKQATAPKRSMAASEGNPQDDEEEEETVPANPDFQERPNNGASIGAWIGDRHLPPVSFGGLVIVDDKPYGMTVHHMLDDPDQIDHPPSLEEFKPTHRSMARPEEDQYDRYAESSGESSGPEDFACEFSDSDSDTSETDITSDASDDDEEYDSEDEDGEYNEPGDIPGVEPGCGEGYIVTQPAMDDVSEGFYPSAETAAEDHLDTFSLGEVYASSGIRRRTENGLVHEIDWALFEFHDDRLPDDNSIPRIRTSVSTASGKRSPSESLDLHPTTVVPVGSLPGLEVQCVARTSGLQSGLIQPAITSVKIFGRTSPSHTYQVTSTVAENASQSHPEGKPLLLGIPGDSGAWVVERRHGRVCGHVLAWSARKQVAYICPMDILLLDIAETLEASEIRLPGGDTIMWMKKEEDEQHEYGKYHLGDDEPASSPFLDPQDEGVDMVEEYGDGDDDKPPVLVSATGKLEKAAMTDKSKVELIAESSIAGDGDRGGRGRVEKLDERDLRAKMESLGVGDSHLGVETCS